MTTQFTADLAGFKQKVSFVKNGLGSNKTDLAASLIRFNLTGSKLVMFTADKEMFCRASLNVNRVGDGPDGTFAVIGQRLSNLLATVESETLSLQFDEEALQITAGFLTVNLTLYDGMALRQAEANLSAYYNENGVITEREFLEEALACARSCSTTSSIRPDVTHVELRGKKMLSSDGRKILMYDYSGFDANLKLKVPAGLLASAIGAVRLITHEKVLVQEESSYYVIKGGLNEFALGIRKVEREFPAVETQMGKSLTPSDEISVDKHVLESALKGVALGLDNDEVRVMIEADGSGKEAYVEISAKNGLGRRSYERASCGRNGKAPTSFPVSYKHVTDTLSVFKGDSVVDLVICAPMNMLLVKDVTNKRSVTTIIPFRTDSQIEKEKQEAAAAEEARKKDKAESGGAPADDNDAAAGAVDLQETEDVELT